MKKRFIIIFSFVVCCLCHASIAQLQLPIIFTDNMVLQQNMELPVWGSSCKNCKVEVSFNDITKRTYSDNNGQWKLRLPSIKAGGPYTLKVSDKHATILLKNILVGEVWLCSGQSNMEWRLEQSSNAKEEIPNANFNQIRLFSMVAQSKARPLANVVFSDSLLDALQKGTFYEPTTWQVCTPSSASKFSAVAYYFGKALHQKLNVPIGLICNAVGGTTTQAFIDSISLASHPQLQQFIGSKNGLKWFETAKEIHPWVLERSKENLQKTLNDSNTARTFLHPFAPSFLYKKGIQPLVPFAIKGVIWYQGESNATHPTIHDVLFETLAKNWRIAWQQADLPIYTVQLPAIANRSRWPAFRESQMRLSERIKNSGIAIMIDTGDSLDVHPTQKQVVGERLSLLALAKTYHQRIVYTGPTLTRFEQKGNIVHLFFNNTNNLKTSDGQSPKGFVLQGYNLGGTQEIIIDIDDKVTILPTEIVITLPTYIQAIQIKYAWKPNPSCNIVNEVDLPLAPFKIELDGNF